MARLTLFCALALAVALIAVPASAEVQNIKLSGDITLRHFNRSSMTLGSTAANPGDEEFFTSTTRVRVDADLTDNVATTVVLANERDWGRDAINQTDVNIEQAFIVLKEFFYQPLTLTLGRQNLWFGKGFIVGTNVAAFDPDGALAANEFSTFTAFDAIKATLDYNPWTVDLVYAKIVNSNTTTRDDDEELYGLNIGYKFDQYNAEAETYYFYKHDSTNVAANTTVESENVHTTGLRGSLDPIANTSIWAEGAYQFGDYDPSADMGGATAVTRVRRAFAADIGGEYRLVDYAWEPKLGLEYIFYSGDSDPLDTQGKYKGWDRVYRGKFDTLLREHHGRVYATNELWDGPSWTNQHQFAAFAGISPMDALTIDGRYTHFRAARTTIGTTTPPHTRHKHLGDEVDFKLTYDYTEDVQFGLLAGWFVPGAFYKAAVGDTAEPKAESTASEIVGSVKVTF